MQQQWRRSGKKKDKDVTQKTVKYDGFLSFTPGWMLMYCFSGFFFFWNFILFMTKLRLLVLSFPDFRDIPISVIREVTLSLGPSLTLWSLFHPQIWVYQEIWLKLGYQIKVRKLVWSPTFVFFSLLFSSWLLMMSSPVFSFCQCPSANWQFLSKDIPKTFVKLIIW